MPSKGTSDRPPGRYAQICFGCNSIEGKIRTIYGPTFPRLIQEYLDRYAAFCAERAVAPM